MKRRHIYLIGEQIFFSGAAFFVNINASRNLDVFDYGIFALYFTAGVLLVGLQRAALYEPLLLLYGNSDLTLNSAIRYCLKRSLFLGVLYSVVSALCMYLLGFQPQWYYLAFFLIGPFLQDSTRFLTLILINERWAFASGGMNLILQVGFSYLVFLRRESSYEAFLIAWGIASLIGALTTLSFLTFRFIRTPKLQIGTVFKKQSLSFGFDYLLGIVSLQSTLTIATITGGASAAAALRGADALIGPVRIILQSLPQLFLSRWANEAAGYRYKRVGKLTAAAALPLGLAAVGVLAIPEEVGSLIMGASWFYIRQVLPFAVLALVPIMITQLSTLGIKSLGDNRRLLLARFVTIPVTVVCGGIGALLGQAQGAALGSLVGSCIAASFYFLTLRKAETSGGTNNDVG